MARGARHGGGGRRAATGDGNPQPAAYSNYGSWVDAWHWGRGQHVLSGELHLPGRPVRQFGGFAAWAGTSFATAYTSGRLAALMPPGLGAEQARVTLLAGNPLAPDSGVLVG